MKRGPKPKPTALKILEGAQPCRINGDEPAIVPGSTEPPDWMTPESYSLALELWNEVVPILAAGRVLSVGDRANLILLCLLYREWRTDLGDRKAIDQFVRLSLEFGLTPSSRSRIKVAAEKPKDELEDFLGTKKAR